MAKFDSFFYHKAVVPYFIHKIQLARLFLCFMAAILSFEALNEIINQQVLYPPQNNLLKSLALLKFLFSLLPPVLWSSLFRDPNSVFGFRRPSQGYRRAVYTTSLCSTLPCLSLYIITIIVILGSTDQGAGPQYLALFNNAMVMAVFYFMVKLFFLGDDDDGRHYEPARAPSKTNHSLPNELSPLLLSSDLNTPGEGDFTSSNSLLVPHSPLEIAYFTQSLPETRVCSLRDDHPASSAGATQTACEFGIPDASNMPQTTALNSSNMNQVSRLQCKTVARFDYMPQSRTGPHSWPSLTLVAIVLGSMSVSVLICFCGLTYKIQESSLKVSAPINSLINPLGGLILCLYSVLLSRYRFRKSSFSRSFRELPPNWTEKRSLVAKPVFVHSEHGTSTTIDPRCRAYPAEGINMQYGYRVSQYVKAYNASPSTCDGYWGHDGRKWTTKFRILPTISSMYFFGFPIFLLLKGWELSYVFLIDLDHALPLNSTNLPKPEYEQVKEILSFWRPQTVFGFVLLGIGWWFVIFCIGSILTLGRGIVQEMRAYDDTLFVNHDYTFSAICDSRLYWWAWF